MIKPEESKQIRRSLGLSQKAVSAQTTVCNTDISKFENGKLIMNAKDLISLSNFYKEQLDKTSPLNSTENQQEAPKENSETENNKLNNVNGIMIPESFDIDEAFELMERYQDNRENLSETLREAVKRDWLGNLDMRVVLNRVLVPMAENYSIVNFIQGYDEILNAKKEESERLANEDNIETFKDALIHLFSKSYTESAN